MPVRVARVILDTRKLSSPACLDWSQQCNIRPIKVALEFMQQVWAGLKGGDRGQRGRERKRAGTYGATGGDQVLEFMQQVWIGGRGHRQHTERGGLFTR